MTYPSVKKPKLRRGGKIVRLRRRLAGLKSAIYADPPPPRHIASELWILVGDIETQMQQRKN